MNKLVLMTSVTAFALVSGVAGAVTLTNHDKAETTVIVHVDGKKEEVKLKENASFDSKGKDAKLRIGKEEPVAAKADERFIIQNGKIEVEKMEAAPAAGSTAIDTKIETKTDAAPAAKAGVAVETDHK